MRRYEIFAITGITLLVVVTISLYRNQTVPSLVTDQWEAIRKYQQSQVSADQGSGEQGDEHTPRRSHLIPPNIWQIMLPEKGSSEVSKVDPERLQDTASWLALNAGYLYTLVGSDAANRFLHEHFSHEPHTIQLYEDLPNVGMKSDLLRYLILSVEGGVYTDTDTVALRPIDNWVPESLRNKVRLIVGVEFDRRDGGGWADIPHWLQFCQWTIAAAPGHPVFPRMVDRIFRSVKEMSDTQSIPIPELKPGNFDVMNSTGPAAWTDVIFSLLQEHDSSLNTTKDLSFMTEPRLYGDMLVLTIDGFGMGQSHSHSTHDGSIPNAALMKHLFRGSWREDER